MLLKILAWIWIISGILFSIKPEWLRNKLQKKSIKKVRRTFFGIALVLGILLIKATWGMSGLIPKVLLVLGIVGIIKAFFFLKAKTAEKMIEWFLRQSITFFRIWAGCMLVFGLFILYVK